MNSKINKCNVVNCSNSHSKSETILCRGLCRREFHGACLSLERNWISSRLRDNFICDECVSIDDAIEKRIEKLSKHILDQWDSQGQLLNRCSKIIQCNTEVFADLCAQFDKNGNVNNIQNSELSANRIYDTLQLSIDNQYTRLREKFDEFFRLSSEKFDALSARVDKALLGKIISDEAYKPHTEALKTELQPLNCKCRYTSSTTNIPDSVTELSTDKLTKFGEKWTRDEWLNRLNKLEAANDNLAPKELNRVMANNQSKPKRNRGSANNTLSNTVVQFANLHIKSTKTRLSPATLIRFIAENFRINVIKCTNVSPKRITAENRKFASFKVEIPADSVLKLTSNDTSHTWKKIGVTATRWQQIMHPTETGKKKFESKNNNESLGIRDGTRKRNDKYEGSVIINDNAMKSDNRVNEGNLPLPSKQPQIRQPESSRYNNFVQGETIASNFPPLIVDNRSKHNPYKQIASINDTPNNSSFINPLVPPIVRLTQNASRMQDSLYDLSRLREHRVYENVRLYLAYLHDNEDDCIGGRTKLNIGAQIQAEGLPTVFVDLMDLYVRYHGTLGISKKKVENDLASYRSHIHSERMYHLDKVRGSLHQRFRQRKLHPRRK